MTSENKPCSATTASSPLTSLSSSARIPVLVLLGPTAIGKSHLALELADKLDLEILSCDSRQIYRKMNVGTAKPTSAQLQQIRHWFIDILDPAEEYSAFRFAEDALSTIRQRAAAGKRLLVCGGTGFYFKALAEGGSEGIPSDPVVRDELTAFAEKNGNMALHLELEKIDPQSAARLHPNDRQRIIRAIAVYRQTGSTISSHKNSGKPPDDCNFIIAKLSMPRDVLYKRINNRVEEMFKHGLWEEFQSLVAEGYTDRSPGMQCVGYKELFPVLRGEENVRQATEHIKQNTRNYAKRQITWFTSQTGGSFFEGPASSLKIKEYYIKV